MQMSHLFIVPINLAKQGSSSLNWGNEELVREETLIGLPDYLYHKDASVTFIGWMKFKFFGNFS